MKQKSQHHVVSPASTVNDSFVTLRTSASTYIGQINSDGLHHGHGKLVLNNGGWYEGQFNGGIRHGVGTSKFGPSGRADGSFDSGGVFVGEWQNGRKHGRGKLIYNNGEGEYVGDFHSGRKHGSGRMTYGDGSVYDGGWRDGKWHGHGVCISKSGKQSEGVWKSGKQLEV